jgi:hypothetical protein
MNAYTQLKERTNRMNTVEKKQLAIETRVKYGKYQTTRMRHLIDCAIECAKSSNYDMLLGLAESCYPRQAERDFIINTYYRIRKDRRE